MHAIGPGILILETQQSSDTTYRLYDFDRLDNQGQLRPLHLHQSLDVLNLHKPENSTPSTIRINDTIVTTLAANPFFTVEKCQIDGEVRSRQTSPYSLVSIIDAQGELFLNGKTYPLSKGEHFIIPNTIQEWTYRGTLTLINSHI